MLGPSASAADYGVSGQTFPIIEADLLSVIENKLRSLEASGKLADMQEEMKRTTIARVRRPVPVANIGQTSVRRSWMFDPTLTVENDITDNDGNIIARRGQKVNPLETLAFSQRLIFVNGDRREEIDWAVANGDPLKTKVIFVAGSPFDEMKGYQRRFYFDQAGVLVNKFGIRNTPALVEPNGLTLKITEFPILKGKGGT